MDKCIIKTEHLGFSYEDYEAPENRTGVGQKTEIPALADINLRINEGEYVAILGHNGSGKSTLAKLLNMILLPTEGRIYIAGRDITAPDFSEDDVFEVRHTDAGGCEQIEGICSRQSTEFFKTGNE